MCMHEMGREGCVCARVRWVEGCVCERWVEGCVCVCVCVCMKWVEGCMCVRVHACTPTEVPRDHIASIFLEPFTASLNPSVRTAAGIY